MSWRRISIFVGGIILCNTMNFFIWISIIHRTRRIRKTKNWTTLVYKTRGLLGVDLKSTIINHGFALLLFDIFLNHFISYISGADPLAHRWWPQNFLHRWANSDNNKLEFMPFDHCNTLLIFWVGRYDINIWTWFFATLPVIISISCSMSNSIQNWPPVSVQFWQTTIYKIWQQDYNRIYY